MVLPVSIRPRYEEGVLLRHRRFDGLVVDVADLVVLRPGDDEVLILGRPLVRDGHGDIRVATLGVVEVDRLSEVLAAGLRISLHETVEGVLQVRERADPVVGVVTLENRVETGCV